MAAPLLPPFLATTLVAARALLPQPDYYANKPSTHWNGTKMVASFNDYLSCCFHTEWYSMAEALSCRNGPDSCVNYQFTGPVWGHLNLRTTTIDWFLK